MPSFRHMPQTKTMTTTRGTFHTARLCKNLERFLSPWHKAYVTTNIYCCSSHLDTPLSLVMHSTKRTKHTLTGSHNFELSKMGDCHYTTTTIVTIITTIYTISAITTTTTDAATTAATKASIEGAWTGPDTWLVVVCRYWCIASFEAGQLRIACIKVIQASVGTVLEAIQAARDTTVWMIYNNIWLSIGRALHPLSIYSSSDYRYTAAAAIALPGGYLLRVKDWHLLVLHSYLALLSQRKIQINTRSCKPCGPGSTWHHNWRPG